MLATRPWWTPSFPQRFTSTRAVMSLPVVFFPVSSPWRKTSLKNWRILVPNPCQLLAVRLPTGNADVSKWAASTHEATRNWLTRLNYHVLRGLSLVRQKVFPGIKVSLKAAVTLVNLYTTQGYRMVPFNLKVLAKFGFCSNCSQTLHDCSPACARKIFFPLLASQVTQDWIEI